MARPKKDDSEKKVQLNIRVKPTTKRDLEAYAEQESCTVSAKAEQLIEAMLKLSDGADQETIDLLSDIVAEIQTVQSITQGKWHEDLATWAAVSDMLQRGPVVQWKPPSALDDEGANKVYDEITIIKLEKQSLIRAIQILGVEVSQDVTTTQDRWVGMFGRRKIPAISNRDAERVGIEGLEDDAAKQKARMIFEMIEEADAREAEADARWTQLLKPYFDTELDGRASYREYRKKEAMKQLSSGIMPSFEDLSL